jgi:putative FmdB family regulatory protein
MPIYEYKCNACGAEFEVLQKFSDAPLTEHEGCGGAVERLLSAPAFQFKGSGFYITDYSKGGNGRSAPKKETDAPAAKAGEAGTKPAAEPSAPAKS